MAVSSEPESSKWIQPTDADFFTIVGTGKPEFLDRALSVIENEQVPLTKEGLKNGSKLFGAMILSKSNLSTVVVATNTESNNPLLHGEITAINQFYGIPKQQRPAARDCIFVATHEPCPLCLSGITWGGFDNFFYLFSYEDSRDEYGIPHDIEMMDEIFGCPNGSYHEKNKYWSAWGLQDLIASMAPDEQAVLNERVSGLKRVYAEMSTVYQKAKAAGTGADVPFK